jgi:hypothetical protein
MMKLSLSCALQVLGDKTHDEELKVLTRTENWNVRASRECPGCIRYDRPMAGDQWREGLFDVILELG